MQMPPPPTDPPPPVPSRQASLSPIPIAPQVTPQSSLPRANPVAPTPSPTPTTQLVRMSSLKKPKPEIELLPASISSLSSTSTGGGGGGNAMALPYSVALLGGGPSGSLQHSNSIGGGRRPSVGFHFDGGSGAGSGSSEFMRRGSVDSGVPLKVKAGVKFGDDVGERWRGFEGGRLADDEEDGEEEYEDEEDEEEYEDEDDMEYEDDDEEEEEVIEEGKESDKSTSISIFSDEETTTGYNPVGKKLKDVDGKGFSNVRGDGYTKPVLMSRPFTDEDSGSKNNTDIDNNIHNSFSHNANYRDQLVPYGNFYPPSNGNNSQSLSRKSTSSANMAYAKWSQMNPPLKPISRSTHTSTTSVGLSKYPHAHEVSETMGTKSKETGFIFFAVVFNAMISVFTIMLINTVILPISPSMVTYAGGVLLQLILLMSNEITSMAVDHAVTIYFGGRYTEKKGYSLAACFFMQQNPLMRFSFTQKLSLNSPCRVFLQRVSLVFLILEAVNLLGPIGASGVIGSAVRDVSSPIDCILFDQPEKPLNRGYPTLETTAGVMEYVFGDALGCLRSQRDQCTPFNNASRFLFGPQIMGAIESGSTIIGRGYGADIHVDCTCTNITDGLTSSLVLSERDRMTVLDYLGNSTLPFMYMSSVHSYKNAPPPTGSSIGASGGESQSHIVLGNIGVCGGLSSTILPVCKTQITQPFDALISCLFLTDGTPASIALARSDVYGTLDPAADHSDFFIGVKESFRPIQMSTLHHALHSIFPNGTLHPFPSTVPGMISAMLYWTSRELTAVSPTLFEPGVETLVAALLRAGLQRTLKTEGTMCRGYASMKSLVEGANNAEEHVIWQALDTVVRIGEYIEGIDANVGQIKMDRPKLIRPLQNGKLYT
ncbi:hypothetical protein HDV05_005811 [Chytridiales sp. JEL 0842]|nr:hypothetical protein HDV05_005811 [Chytridiales sp. JEL 0842]